MKSGVQKALISGSYPVDILDMRLLKHVCFQQFFKFFALWPPSTYIWLIGTVYPADTFEYSAEFCEIFKANFLLISGYYTYDIRLIPWYPDIRCTIIEKTSPPLQPPGHPCFAVAYLSSAPALPITCLAWFRAKVGNRNARMSRWLQGGGGTFFLSMIVQISSRMVPIARQNRAIYSLHARLCLFYFCRNILLGHWT